MLKRTFLIIPVLLLGTATPVSSEATDAGTHFSRGKELIEANCGDCIGATREGLEAGITEIEAAIAAGYAEPLKAHALLGDAYRTLAYAYEEADSAAQRAALERYRAQCAELVRMAPEDPAIRYEYATSLPDREAQRAAYREVLEIDPDYTAARFALGMLLVEAGQRDDGISEIKRAITEEDDPAARDLYERRLQGIVQQNDGDGGNAAGSE